MKIRKFYCSFNSALIFALVMLFSNNCIKKTSSNEIFKDDFNRTTGFGSKWTINSPSGASFAINANRAYPTSGGTTAVTLPAAIYTEKVKGNFKVSSKFIIGSTKYDNMGWLFARSAASDTAADSYVCGYYYVAATTTPVAAEQYVFALGKAVSSNIYVFGQIAMHTLNPGISDTITFTLDSTSLKCEMAGNSTIAISVKDSTYGDGYTGIWGGGGTANSLFFDDFLAEKL